MPRIPLSGRAYQERSVIAGAMKTINLYEEMNSDDAQAPSPSTYYLTPGTLTFANQMANGKVRCLYRTSLGTAYTVIGPNLYAVAVNGALSFIGTIPDRQSQVIMADNGLAVVLVDGTSGWAINMVSNVFGPIIDPSFFGAAFVVFLDTFFIFNRPGTNQFYISLSQVSYTLLTAGTSFDPLDIAAKSGSADPIVAIITDHKELWLIGQLTTEVWIGTGAADFYFQLVQGAYIEHGCIAAYSAANQDIIAFWLMQDKQGKCIVVAGSNYQVNEISTPFLVAEFSKYTIVNDAIGFCFQIDDHAFYCIVFPQANKTWLYELKTKQWNEWNWFNQNTGILNRHRSNCCMYFNENLYVGDFENGKIYELDSDLYTDDTVPIPRIKTFAHLVEDLDRVIYKHFDADVEVGTNDPASALNPPVMSLSWSDDRGITFGFPIDQSMGKGGEFLTIVSWNRLGMARDRIFRLQWSGAIKTALNGGFIDAVKAR